MKPRDLDHSIQDAFDGELDDARAHRLREALKESPELLEQYCRHALLESELHRHASGLGRISPETTLPPVSPAPFRRHRRNAILAAAAVLLLAGFGLYVRRAPLADLEITPGSTLSYANRPETPAGPLRRNQEIALDQGVVRLKLRSGTEAVIEGPATFSLKNADTLELSSGHAWFHVPGQARGFRVITPWMEVVDLGTEFGIDQREDRKPQVHVIDGKIEAISRIGSPHRLELNAGEAATISTTGKWELVHEDSGGFRNGLPQSLPVLKMDFEEILQDTLRMEGDMLGIRHAQARIIHPERVRLVPGVSGNAIEFRGDGAYIETTWEGISGTAPRTVSLWCRIPRGIRQQTAPPLAWWGNPALGWNRKFKVALFTDATGKTVLRSSFGEHYSNGTTPLADGRWHHLAVVYRSNNEAGLPDISCYVDGKREMFSSTEPGPGRIETDTRSEGSGCLTIGRYELAEHGRNPYLSATIDEFRIFAGALDDEAIRELADPR